MTIIKLKEQIFLSEAEILAIERTLDILYGVIAESEDDETLDLVADAKAPLIELLSNVFKRE